MTLFTVCNFLRKLFCFWVDAQCCCVLVLDCNPRDYQRTGQRDIVGEVLQFCDLYSKGRDIIHVKQYGGSSLLSHLFNTVCVAIMTKVSGPLEIQFFSKVSLNHAVKSLQRMGFRMTKRKVEC